MNFLKQVTRALLITSVLCFAALSGTKEIEVSGIISDGSSPLEGVSVSFPGSIVDTALMEQTYQEPKPPRIILDNLKTDSDGKFSTKVTVQDTLSRIPALAGKKDFLLGGDSATISGTTIDMGTITLTKALQEGTNRVLDDILVKGTVEDVDGNAVKGATVILGEMRIGSELRQEIKIKVLDNLETSDDGKFTRSVNYTPPSIPQIPKVIMLMVFKKSFVQRGDTISINGSNADAGTVILKKPVATSITNFAVIKNNLFSQPKTVTLFSVDGKKLYSGKILDFNKILSKNSLGCQPIIIQYDLSDNNRTHYKTILVQK